MNSISSSSRSFTTRSRNEIIYITCTDESGNNGGADFVWQTKRTVGGSLVELMRLDGPTGSVGVGLISHATYKLDVNGDCNPPLGVEVSQPMQKKRKSTSHDHAQDKST